MQGGPAHGFPERMPGLVRKASVRCRYSVFGLRFWVLGKSVSRIVEKNYVRPNVLRQVFMNQSVWVRGNFSHATMKIKRAVARKNVGTTKK